MIARHSARNENFLGKIRTYENASWPKRLFMLENAGKTTSLFTRRKTAHKRIDSCLTEEMRQSTGRNTFYPLCCRSRWHDTRQIRATGQLFQRRSRYLSSQSKRTDQYHQSAAGENTCSLSMSKFQTRSPLDDVCNRRYRSYRFLFAGRGTRTRHTVR